MLGWRHAAAGILIVALAGCAQPDGEKAVQPGTSTMSETDRLARQPSGVPLTTDVLYLATFPHMTTAFPNSAGPQATPFESGAENGFTGFLQWEYPLTTAGTLTSGNATIWFHVPPGSVRAVNHPLNPTCPWSVLLAVRSDAGEHAVGSGCAPSSEVLHPGGDAAVEFSFAGGSGLAFQAGDLLVLTIGTWWTAPPGQAVAVLHGVSPYDSHLQARGLAERLEEAVEELLEEHPA